ncbi:MAG: hypothetical protein NC248_11495, partial [Bacteroides sp.]|nr:hypothetical protein [Bacteroides sp.]
SRHGSAAITATRPKDADISRLQSAPRATPRIRGSVGVLRQALTSQNPTDNDSGSRWSRPKYTSLSFRK